MPDVQPLPHGAIADLARVVEGTVLQPGSSGYDEARTLWNARFDRRPDLIVRCASAGDVSTAIGFARGHGLRLSVKGGGHQYAGNTIGDGGLLIDLGPMQSIAIDAHAGIATVGAGATWGLFDAAAQQHGLATSGGTVSTVGVSGVALGGGEGWLSRSHGLTCDNVLAANVVTASGAIVRASEFEHADLLWALRGGGGNFGVVTSFQFRLHPLGPEVVAGQVIYPLQQAEGLLRFYRDYFEDAPDELTCYPFFFRIPPVDAFPAERHGELVLSYVLAWVGPVSEAARYLDPFKTRGTPIVSAIAPVSYVTLQTTFDPGMKKGNRWYTRAHYIDELTDEAIHTLVTGLDPFPGDFTTVYLGPGGGAVGRVPADAAAYPHRRASHGLHVFPGWTDPAHDRPVMEWARCLSDAMAPYASGGVYVNLLAEDETARVRAAYGPNYDRLAMLKKRWDPDNLFQGNHNIEPAA